MSKVNWFGMGSSPTKMSQSSSRNANSSSHSARQRERSDESAAAESDHCIMCEKKFPLLGMKDRCNYCGRTFCSDCGKTSARFRGTNSPRYGNAMSCMLCQILNGPMYKWDELMLLKARHLKEFLKIKRIDTSKCIGKEDLVELILQTFSTDAFFRAQVEHQQQVAKMILRFQEDTSSARPNYDADALAAAQIISEEHSGRTSASETAARPVSAASSQSAHNRPQAAQPDAGGAEYRPSPSRGSSQGVEPPTSSQTAASSSSRSEQPASAESGTDAWRTRGTHERVLIDEVTREEYLSELSSKQMKDMLAFNFVNYRGILEKSELLDLVRSLWRSRNAVPEAPVATAAVDEQASAAATAKEATATGTEAAAGAKRDLDDREICKICMEREIDCVLLECGHLVTCTECGRVLADCPICRRCVLRVVHIFKS